MSVSEFLVASVTLGCHSPDTLDLSLLGGFSDDWRETVMEALRDRGMSSAITLTGVVLARLHPAEGPVAWTCGDALS